MNPIQESPDPRHNDSANAPVAASREALARLIRDFLASDITAFQFDEQLQVFRISTDPVSRYVATAVWYYYDDCTDHRVALSKQRWDDLQRLLLVLASDSRVETHVERTWSLRQLIAAVTLIAVAVLAVSWGVGIHWLLLTIPAGMVSIALSRWPSDARRRLDPYWSISHPFHSLGDLETAYRSSGFRKARYPQELGERRRRGIRSPLLNALLRLYLHAIWMVFSPIPLVFQMFPTTRTESRIRVT